MVKTLQGFGVGLRKEFSATLIETDRSLDWIEITPENWLGVGGRSARLLARYAERWPLVPHSVSLSIGGTDALDEDFLSEMSGLCYRIEPAFWSDHLSCSRIEGVYVNDLLPLPFTEEVIEHVVSRIEQVRRRSGVDLVFENATYYAHMPGCTMGEAEFLVRILETSQSGMLLDVNNVFVNSQNHGFDPMTFIDRIPFDRVREIHLAGHTRVGDDIIDTHRGPIIDDVWALYRYTLRRAGRLIPTA
jgi:uncharacterized protein (UPF0276 family)